MTKRLLLMLWFVAMFLLGLTAGHIGTIMNMEIETPDEQTAIVTTFAGQQYLYSTNGHDLNGNGETIHDLGRQP